MYRFTEKMFKEVKAERFTVITFENGRRVSTFGGLHLLDAVKEVMKVQGTTRNVLLAKQETVEAWEKETGKRTHLWEQEAFADLFELAKKDGRDW